VPTKKYYSPILKDFTPFDPFEAGRNKKPNHLKTFLIAVVSVIAGTAGFLALIYFWP
jgi:hypothetical protein